MITQESQNKIDIALSYVALGWSVIPVRHDKKPFLPSWREYQDRQASKEEIIDWFTRLPEAGIGIVTGKISNLVVLDLDPGYDETKLQEFGLEAGISVRTPRGGKHLYAKHPGIFTKTRTDLFGNNSHIDIRGDGGYVVAPPSISETGKSYEWINGPENINLIVLNPNLIEIINNKPSSNNFTESKQNNFFEGVSEGSRNDTAAKIIGQLISKLSVNEWEPIAWPIAKEWNQRNTPPLEQNELWSVFESISKVELSKTRLNKNEVGPKIDLGEPISIGELDKKDIPEAKWVVEYLFETGTMNMLSAPPNQYKSWVLQYMAICIARGERVFDYFNTIKQGVLIINEEDGERMIKERSKMLTNSSLLGLDVYFYIMKGFKMNPDSVHFILNIMKEKGLTFLMLDSLRAIHDSNENSSQEMLVITNFIQLFLREGITVLFTHHNRKVQKAYKNDDDGLGEEIRGSSGINAAVHSHLSIEVKNDEAEKYLVFHQRKLKCAPKLKPFKVQLIIDEIDNESFGFEYKGEHNDIREAVNKKTPILFEFFENQPNIWFSIKDLVDKNIMSKGDKTARMALNDLVDNKKLITITAEELKKETSINVKIKNNTKFYKKVVLEEHLPEQLETNLPDW